MLWISPIEILVGGQVVDSINATGAKLLKSSEKPMTAFSGNGSKMVSSAFVIGGLVN